jgi:hypothetical protein
MGFRHRPGLSVRLVDGEVVIVDRETEKIHQLNSTASFVWNRLVGEYDLLDIARELSAVFDVEENAAMKDVGRIVDELRELRVLVPLVEMHS